MFETLADSECLGDELERLSVVEEALFNSVALEILRPRAVPERPPKPTPELTVVIGDYQLMLEEYSLYRLATRLTQVICLYYIVCRDSTSQSCESKIILLNSHPPRIERISLSSHEVRFIKIFINGFIGVILADINLQRSDILTEDRIVEDLVETLDRVQSVGIHELCNKKLLPGIREDLQGQSCGSEIFDICTL